ncbi:shikimate dehydrogenase [Mannheimia sp. AT1]|uniref:Shikimate dehydrogenase (NADP(+)) n=1 Tax=Mannheimia cairinae TaxID=3025936 RepID=A0ABT5MQQ9_9PAST|nr:shikimate dehydrogenase [Mannheimia cairinae]MDD0824523.1 shikimate dehydrogenase [Mannheimia cairinae]MDD0825624.1 shikimate dehydrogenase [Mannheimia cairinae]
MKNKYAVWGNPIAQSKSPRIHQLFAQQTKKEIEYVAKLGDETEFEQQLKDFFAKGAKGCNITAPFKERAFQLADEYSEACLLAKACNTLKRLEDGRLYADNTDGVGLAADLERLGWLNSGQKTLILGAGGATKGVLLPLLKAGLDITLYNRTVEKAVVLAEKFANYGKIQTACVEELENQKFDLIINATSLGLQGHYVALPANLLASAKVYDMQYAVSMKTPFLNYAKECGAMKCQDGLGMLVGQAAFAFNLWEEKFPDIEKVLIQLQTEMQPPK